MLNVTDVVLLDEIRATLGVDDVELPDNVLNLEMYRLNLNAEIQAVDSTLETKFGVVQAVEEANRTEMQQGLFIAVSLFSLYAVALQLTEALPIFSPKTITDGKASLTRYSDSPYKETIKAIKEKYNGRREALIAALAVYDGTSAATAVPPSYMGVSSPDFDPVTGS